MPKWGLEKGNRAFMLKKVIVGEVVSALKVGNLNRVLCFVYLGRFMEPMKKWWGLLGRILDLRFLGRSKGVKMKKNEKGY